jgi:hypothetical protein
VIPIVAFAPFLHGRLGPLDELELCLAPIVVAITVLIYRFLSRRTARRPDRALRRRAPGEEKDG